jgi:drug/metabolite transporter (DMT)-like permease
MGEARRWASAPMVLFWSSLIGAPLLLAVALALGERIWPTTGLGWAACVGLGLMHVAGQGSIAWALGRLQASLAAVVVLVQPVVAAICGWIAFGEGLSPLQALGGALALAGVAVAQAYGRRAGEGAKV